MKLNRTLVLIVSSILLLSACSNESDEAVVTVTENSNPLLAYVPVDTAYVMADLESVPAEITDAYVSRFQPVLDVLSTHIQQFQADYAAGEFEDNQMARLATAVLDELGGDLSSENLANFGISLQAHHAIHAMGVFPVIRVELSDAQALRDAIARIEASMGVELPEKNHNGINYWRVGDDEIPVGLYIAILDRQLALSLFPVGAEDSLLAAFLGQQMPATSMANNNTLAILNSEKGYSNYGSGILDLQKLADELLNPNSDTRTYLGPEMSGHLASVDPVCAEEIRSMVARAPRMTVGTTKFTANEIGMRYELEFESSLASSLAALVSDTPAAVDGDFLLSASLALNVGKLRNFMLEKASAIVAAPYQCEKLEQLNDQAAELVAQLNIPMPPMVNNLKGLRVQVDDFEPGLDMLKGNGLLAIHVDKPEMFVGMASMFVPGFEDLDVANQSEPVRIPSEMLQMEGLDVFALVNDNAIGVSLGEQHAKDLAGFMTAKSQNNGTFLSVSYDMVKQMEIQAALSEKHGIDPDEDHSPVHQYSEAVRQVYIDMLGRSRLDMRMTGEALVIDSEMTFK